MNDFQHDDFEVVCKDNRDGGFEEVKRKDGWMSVRYFFPNASAVH